jgi:hypothetical protein
MATAPDVRAETACKIVGLEPSVLTDVLNRKLYPCVPPATQGKHRVFDEAALLSLYFFARLLDCNIKAPWAGPVACEMAAYLADRERDGGVVDSFVMLIGERNPVAFGNSHPTLVKWMPGDEWDTIKGNPLPVDDDGDEDDIGANVVMTLTFEIKTVRAIIADMVQHEIQQFLAGKSGPL